MTVPLTDMCPPTESMTEFRAARARKAPTATPGNRRARHSRIVLALILVLLLPGCTSFKGYSGPEREPNEIAIITAKYWQKFGFFGRAYLVFTSLDGIPTHPDHITNEVHMEVGGHEVAFRYEFENWCGGYLGCVVDDEYFGSLSFTAQKGHRYILDADRSGDRLWAWIIDEASGQIIAGEQPTKALPDE